MKLKPKSGVASALRAVSASAVPSILIATTIAVTVIMNTPICGMLGQALADAQSKVQKQGCDATTRPSWDVRTAASVSSMTENQLVLNSCDGSPVTYDFDPHARTVSRSKGAEKITVLTGVDSASFSLYRHPSVYNELLPATKDNARIVGLKWTSLCANGASKAPQTAIASLQLASR